MNNNPIKNIGPKEQAYYLFREMTKMEIMMHNQSVYYLLLLKKGFYNNEAVEKCLQINGERLASIYLTIASCTINRQDAIDYINSAIFMHKECKVPSKIEVLAQELNIEYNDTKNEKDCSVSIKSKLSFIIPQKYQEQTSILLNTLRGKKQNTSIKLI